MAWSFKERLCGEVERGKELDMGVAAGGVEFLRPVEGDGGDILGYVVQDVGECHACLRWSVSNGV